jgi:hypothetical protein
MPLLGFQKQFAPMVEAGTKRQTIRLKRKDGRNPKPGDLLYLYTGLRTKTCRKIGEVVCLSVQEITLNWRGVCLSGVWLTAEEREALAKADGFTCFANMGVWFERTHEPEFWGLLVKW